MRKTTGTLLATLLLAATGGSALSAEVTVMISGGFKAALEKLAPAWEKQTGNHLVVIPGPSMGKTPQAIPNRLARGEHADVVIMVGDALTSLEKAGRTQPDSRRELADSPIGVVVKAGAPLPAIHSADQLRATLLAALSGFSLAGWFHPGLAVGLFLTAVTAAAPEGLAVAAAAGSYWRRAAGCTCRLQRCFASAAVRGISCDI